MDECIKLLVTKKADKDATAAAEAIATYNNIMNQLVVALVTESMSEKNTAANYEEKVLKSMDKWYGVTYKEDKPVVVAAIQKLKDEGLYPQKHWEEA